MATPPRVAATRVAATRVRVRRHRETTATTRMRFLEAATRVGVDKAALAYGGKVSAKEMVALKTLNARELKTLFDLNKKIASADQPVGTFQNPGDLLAWNIGIGAYC